MHPAALKLLKDESSRLIVIDFLTKTNFKQITYDLTTDINCGKSNLYCIAKRASVFSLNGDHITINSFAYFERINNHWCFIDGNAEWSKFRRKLTNIPPKTKFPNHIKILSDDSKSVIIAQKIDEMTRNIENTMDRLDAKFRLNKKLYDSYPNI
jgi:hypothetical protein